MMINDEIISGCLICHFKLLDISVQLINSCMAMGSIRDRETNRYLNLIVAGARLKTSSFKVIINHTIFPINIFRLGVFKQNRSLICNQTSLMMEIDFPCVSFKILNNTYLIRT